MSCLIVLEHVTCHLTTGQNNRYYPHLCYTPHKRRQTLVVASLALLHIHHLTWLVSRHLNVIRFRCQLGLFIKRTGNRLLQFQQDTIFRQVCINFSVS